MSNSAPFRIVYCALIGAWCFSAPARAQYRYGSAVGGVARGTPGAAPTSASGTFGFSARNYVYGGYGAYANRPANAPALISPRTADRPPPVANVSLGASSVAPPASPVPPSVPPTPSLTTSYYYGFPGLPSTFFQPTVQSYVPYAQPGLGYTPFAAPVYAVTYAGGTTMSQMGSSASGSSPASFNAQIGYPSYMNPRASWGQDLFPGLAPGQVAYVQSMQAALTPPGYYLNYIAAPGASYQQLHSSNPPRYSAIPPMDTPVYGQTHTLPTQYTGVPAMDVPSYGPKP